MANFYMLAAFKEQSGKVICIPGTQSGVLESMVLLPKTQTSPHNLPIFNSRTLPLQGSGEVLELILSFMPVFWISGLNIYVTVLILPMISRSHVLMQMVGICRMFLRSFPKFKQFLNMKLFIRLQKPTFQLTPGPSVSITCSKVMILNSW